MKIDRFAEIHNYLATITMALLKEAGKKKITGKMMEKTNRYIFTRENDARHTPVLAINHSLARLEVYPEGQNIDSAVFRKIIGIYTQRGYSVSPMELPAE